MYLAVIGFFSWGCWGPCPSLPMAVRQVTEEVPHTQVQLGIKKPFPSSFGLTRYPRRRTLFLMSVLRVRGTNIYRKQNYLKPHE